MWGKYRFEAPKGASFFMRSGTGWEVIEGRWEEATKGWDREKNGIRRVENARRGL